METIINMAQFQVPQFIETESKIVGPLTIKQFAYLGVAGLISFFLFFILRTFFWVIVTLFIGTAALVLAFGRYNGRKLTVVLKNAIIYMWNPKLYLWKRKEEGPAMPTINIPKPKQADSPVSKLKSMWLKLQTKKPSGPPKRPPQPKQETNSEINIGAMGLRIPKPDDKKKS